VNSGKAFIVKRGGGGKSRLSRVEIICQRASGIYFHAKHPSNFDEFSKCFHMKNVKKLGLNGVSVMLKGRLKIDVTVIMENLDFA
jgi:hypothetical protein